MKDVKIPLTHVNVHQNVISTEEGYIGCPILGTVNFFHVIAQLIQDQHVHGGLEGVFHGLRNIEFDSPKLM